MTPIEPTLSDTAPRTTSSSLMWSSFPADALADYCCSPCLCKPMPHQTEPNANNASGSLLRNMLRTCVVRSENTQTFAVHPGRHADALITSPGRSPMVDRELQPVYLADANPNRALLGRGVVSDLPGFDEDIYQGVRRLAAKGCAEPLVHGSKARPKGREADHMTVFSAKRC